MPKKQLQFIELVVNASPLVSGTCQRVQLNPFVPQKVVRQNNFFSALGLPPVVIPKPKPKKAKPIAKEQMSLF